MGDSQKFKLLKQLSRIDYFNKVIPPFQEVLKEFPIAKSFFCNEQLYVLRSSLKSEGSSDNLMSGKSLSVKGISDYQAYTLALEKINSQDELEEILLQEEFTYEDHLTIYAEDDLYYIEIKNELGVNSVIISSSFISGHYRYLNYVTDFLKEWTKLFHGHKTILEAGVSHQGVRLFQANEVNDRIINSLFNNDLIFKIVKSKIQSDEKLGFISLVKKEYRAYLFRKNLVKKTIFTIQDAFNNWSYLFHYFFLYCRYLKKPGVDQDFIDFLNDCQKESHWLSRIIMLHISLSSKIRNGEDDDGVIQIESAFRLVSEECYFLGKGIYNGRVGEIAYLCEELLPEEIYRLDEEKIILTPSHHILSHGFLVAFERGIPVVANINMGKYLSIQNEDFLTANFINKIFMLK